MLCVQLNDSVRENWFNSVQNQAFLRHLLRLTYTVRSYNPLASLRVSPPFEGDPEKLSSRGTRENSYTSLHTQNGELDHRLGCTDICYLNSYFISCSFPFMFRRHNLNVAQVTSSSEKSLIWLHRKKELLVKT